MARPFKKFNPAFLSKQDLIRSFVIRQIELDILLETIRTNTYESNQNILIIGPCGMGKTHLMLRAAAAVQDDEVLGNRWYPIVFGEESYEVFTAGQFWLEALGHLAEQRKEALGEDRWEQIYDRLRDEQDEQRLHDQALARILDFADEQKKRLLLIVENFNLILGDQMSDDEGWLIRRTLLNEPRIMLLATATSRFDEIDNVEKPMYELFKIHTLEPLDEEACGRLLASIGGRKLKAERVRQIQILTGGNPRFLAIIASFASNTSFRELMDDLTDLIDDHTDYFKTNIEKLPALERKVFVTLANIWNPAASREVAKEARINVNKASSLLKRLTERGAVEIKGKGRRQKYQVAERLYNIYYLMRRHGGKSSRVRATVEFMLHFYEGEELVKVTASIAEEACKLETDLRQEHYVAYEEILCFMEPSDAKIILENTNPQFFSLQDLPLSIRKMADQYLGLEKLLEGKMEIVQPSDKIERLSEEEIRAKLLGDPDNSQSWLELGQVLYKKYNRHDEAEQAYRRSIELKSNNPFVWGQLAQLLDEEFDRYDESEDSYRKAIELFPNYVWAWGQLGQLLHFKCGKYEEAEQAYRKTIELDPEKAKGWALLGYLLHDKLSGFEEAEKAYRKAISLESDVVFSWAQLGYLLHENLQRYEEAERVYRKAVELKPEYSWVWSQLGQLLCKNLERYEEAEEACRKAVELEPDVAWGWQQLGYLFHEKLGRYEEAEQAYQKAVILSPDNAWIWGQLGQLLHIHCERHEEAEKAYRKAIELNPENFWALGQLGFLLHINLNRPEEAEQAYREAIRIKPEDAWVWSQLGQLLYENLERYEEAEVACRKAIELEPEVAWGWQQLGYLLHEKLGRYEEAEQAYQKAVKLSPDNAWTWGQLGKLLHIHFERYEEAEQAYRKAIKLKTDNFWAWGQLGVLLHENLNRPDEAEQAYRESIRLKTDYAWIWAKLGGLLQITLKRYEEAEQAYNSLIELNPEDSIGWIFMGLLKEDRGCYEEAEQAYRKAIQFDPEDDTVWMCLIELHMYRMKQEKEAFESIDQYLNKNDRSAKSLNTVAWTFYKSGWKEHFLEAEAWAREAVEKEADNITYQFTLASILGGVAKWPEALDFSTRFLSDPDLTKKNLTDVINLFINVAAAGHAQESLCILMESARAPLVEPLIVAFHMEIGEEHNAPKEIEEVAKDICKRIEGIRTNAG